MNDFVIVTHVVLSNKSDIAGPAHTLSFYLDKKHARHLFIRHALFNDARTLITYSDKNTKKEKILTPIRINELLSRFIEGFITIKYSSGFFKKTKPIYIGIDPLNSLWGVILKKIGKVKKLITYAVDYSPKRYRNIILNSLYHFVDKISVINSDYVWAVSRRILERRLNQGVPQNKLFYVPNSPSFAAVNPLINKNPDPFNVITISTISKAIDLDILIEAVLELVKEFPRLRLTIIGAGPGEGDLIRKVEKLKLTKNIFLIGSKTHEEVFRILSNQGIGVALYTDEASWSFYSDSMKARDYLAMGLPVIISGNLGTTEEIKSRNAGIVIERNKKDIILAIEKLLKDRNLYAKLRANALRFAKEYDIEKILDNVLKNI